MLVLVAPGQGAQKPGFLTPWLDLPGVTERLTWWSAVSGLDLIHYGTKADEEEIRDTAVAQPLLVAAALVSARALFPEDAAGAGGAGNSAEGLPGSARAVLGATAGHSVGEIAAAAVAGVLTEETAMVLVRRRGLAMAEAAAQAETGMSAVLGGEQDEVVAHLTKLGLTPANVNGAGQIVAAGTAEQLAALAADKPEGVRRVVPLAVAGAFHTDHMAPAVSALDTLVAGAPFADPRLTYVSNRDGHVVTSGAEIAQRLVAQVSNPVRWDLCMETFQRLGATAIIEVAPGGTLVGIAKRALPGVKTLALKTPDDLEAARALIAEHAVPVADTPAE
ncbi:ACP S-malonyltransferase [Streptomyces sparsogenes]|uniref:Malonyl CoA-acyl carrier protein transacylase n=1 Tax=Streptomyces sparsogenes DSM 40356 TaxID=1331668 RepID=A0A1R1SIN1_9ACTN|nr:ACP S-malonyltransferase [Streptomyces sparsogenes]OMI38123.1 ACP S-malonyltransferase [Streptomyces sparsogenes DSM 40356]